MRQERRLKKYIKNNKKKASKCRVLGAYIYKKINKISSLGTKYAYTYTQRSQEKKAVVSTSNISNKIKNRIAITKDI